MVSAPHAEMGQVRRIIINCNVVTAGVRQGDNINQKLRKLNEIENCRGYSPLWKATCINNYCFERLAMRLVFFTRSSLLEIFKL